MKIIRYRKEEEQITAAVTPGGVIYPLPYKGFMDLVRDAKDNQSSVLAFVEEKITTLQRAEYGLEEVELLVPIEAPEVWAAGVTYEKSKEARNYEATNGKLDSQTFYDKVYDAERPEIFMKSTVHRTVGPNQDVYIRSDSNWQIPEPELGLVVSGDGEILAYTIGNDMSCRDIEGENPLYLPQAKIWKQSCSIGPALLLAESVEDAYQLDIVCRIYRDNQLEFEGTANTRQLKRKYDELVSYLIKDNVIFDGTVLLTGTCIVPPNEFTLNDGDQVEIEIPQIGVLRNPVKSQETSKVLVAE
ncbi:fumarylacetoacetate hydrolase family protein [Bacillus sp. JJ1533]|uniref:fumarylacetoacetate hydrolase family protein n=1 Tax=Bacillus sp. JJ1533 TaxID=3122959 RepID=UPI002FFE0C27